MCVNVFTVANSVDGHKLKRDMRLSSVQSVCHCSVDVCRSELLAMIWTICNGQMCD